MIESKQQHGDLRQCVLGREKSLAQPQLELGVSTAGDNAVLYRVHHAFWLASGLSNRAKKRAQIGQSSYEWSNGYASGQD